VLSESFLCSTALIIAMEVKLFWKSIRRERQFRRSPDSFSPHRHSRRISKGRFVRSRQSRLGHLGFAVLERPGQRRVELPNSGSWARLGGSEGSSRADGQAPRQENPPTPHDIPDNLLNPTVLERPMMVKNPRALHLDRATQKRHPSPSRRAGAWITLFRFRLELIGVTSTIQGDLHHSLSAGNQPRREREACTLRLWAQRPLP
jgi:hypothetical protein